MLYRYTAKEVDLLGRLMRAEAVGEGATGMLMVGNVITNRIIVTCHVFDSLSTLEDVIYQQNAFSGTNSALFVGRANEKEKQLAEKSLKGYRLWPSTNALWFYAPSGNSDCNNTFYDQQFTGQYKNHCFYRPEVGVCIELR